MPSTGWDTLFWWLSLAPLVIVILWMLAQAPARRLRATDTLGRAWVALLAGPLIAALGAVAAAGDGYLTWLSYGPDPVPWLLHGPAVLLLGSGGGLMLWSLTSGAWRHRRQCAARLPIDGEFAHLLDEVDRLSELAGLRRTPAWLVSGHDGRSPECLVGLRGPGAVVVPPDLEACCLAAAVGEPETAAALVRFVLGHEVSHLANGDALLVTWSTAALRVTTWWFPWSLAALAWANAVFPTMDVLRLNGIRLVAVAGLWSGLLWLLRTTSSRLREYHADQLARTLLSEDALRRVITPVTGPDGLAMSPFARLLMQFGEPPSSLARPRSGLGPALRRYLLSPHPSGFRREARLQLPAESRWQGLLPETVVYMGLCAGSCTTTLAALGHGIAWLGLWPGFNREYVMVIGRSPLVWLPVFALLQLLLPHLEGSASNRVRSLALVRDLLLFGVVRGVTHAVTSWLLFGVAAADGPDPLLQVRQLAPMLLLAAIVPSFGSLSLEDVLAGPQTERRFVRDLGLPMPCGAALVGMLWQYVVGGATSGATAPDGAVAILGYALGLLVTTLLGFLGDDADDALDGLWPGPMLPWFGPRRRVTYMTVAGVLGLGAAAGTALAVAADVAGAGPAAFWCLALAGAGCALGQSRVSALGGPDRVLPPALRLVLPKLSLARQARPLSGCRWTGQDFFCACHRRAVPALSSAAAVLRWDLARQAELDPAASVAWFHARRRHDGGYSRHPLLPGNITATHAAVLALRELGEEPADPAAVLQFVARCRQDNWYAQRPGERGSLEATHAALACRALLGESVAGDPAGAFTRNWLRGRLARLGAADAWDAFQILKLTGELTEESARLFEELWLLPRAPRLSRLRARSSLSFLVCWRLLCLELGAAERCPDAALLAERSLQAHFASTEVTTA